METKVVEFVKLTSKILYFTIPWVLVNRKVE